MRQIRHFQSRVVTVAADASCREVAETLKREGIGSAVVVSQKKPVGIITDRDLLRRVIAAGRDAESTQAAEVMTEPLITVEPADSLEELVKMMSQRGIRRVPVVHKERLEGIVSLDDLLAQLADELDDLATGARRGFREAQRRARAESLVGELTEGLEDIRENLERLGGEARDTLLGPVGDLWERLTGKR